MRQYPLPPGLTGNAAETESRLEHLFETLSANTLTPQEESWILAENALTEETLQPIFVDEEELSETLSYPIIDLPVYTGTLSIRKQHNDLSRQPDIVLTDLTTGEGRLLLDTTDLSNQNLVIGNSLVMSPDMIYVAFSVTPHGSDTGSIYVMDISTGKLLEDITEGIHDPEVVVSNEGIFYSKTVDSKRIVMFHRFMEESGKDVRIYEQEDNMYHWIKAQKVSPDNRWLVISDYHAMADNEYGHDYILKSTDPFDSQEIRIPAEEIGTVFKTEFYENKLYVLSTSRNYPMGILKRFDLAQTSIQGEIMAEGIDKPLTNFTPTEQGLALLYNPDGRSELQFFEFDTQQTYDIELPSLGYISGMTRNPFNNEVEMLFETMTTPPQPIKFIPEDQTIQSEIKETNDADVYILLYEFEGQTIPIYIAVPKDIPLEQLKGWFVSGYGGFNLGNGAKYNDRAAIMTSHGIGYADVMLPGNKGRGEAFHELGMRLNKQKVFDAFRQALETLQTNNHGKPKNTIIFGRSNGGLMVGAALNQYPELFGGAICENPITDVLALGKETSPIRGLELGWLNTEYGNPFNDPTIRAYMQTYSPMQNIQKREQDSPKLLVLGRINDDRALPPQAARFAAIHQMNSSQAVTLLHMGMESGGHGGYIPLPQKVKEEKRILQFVQNILQ